MSELEQRWFNGGSGVSRRRFLQLTAGGLAWLAAGRSLAFAAPYRVGVGKQGDPYAATMRAVDATGEWPSAAIDGRPVVIKPNLVFPMTADTGAVTDPEVVRALVDLSLEAGAVHVSIVEGGFGGANFSPCGYDFFSSYDARVTLVDLNEEPLELAKVPGGLAYHRIYMHSLLFADDVVFISAAKLKTHFHTHATLSMKNLIGLAPIEKYREEADEWRWVMHDRGISQVIVDLNLLRPVDFAVVDGVWAMEGQGPVEGDPVKMDIVVAGRNALAVDRACLWATILPQRGVKHLSYAARKGLGPAGLDGVEVVGDPVTPRPFAWPTNLPPILEYPSALPKLFSPGSGQETLVISRLAFPCQVRIEIVRTSELTTEVIPIRMLRDWESRPSGFDVLMWDGRDDSGMVVAPGRYTMRVKAKYGDEGTEASATGWVKVLG